MSERDRIVELWLRGLDPELGAAFARWRVFGAESIEIDHMQGVVRLHFPPDVLASMSRHIGGGR